MYIGLGTKYVNVRVNSSAVGLGLIQARLDITHHICFELADGSADEDDAIAASAIRSTPCNVAWPPMKPDEWMNTQPGMLAALLSSASRRPHHAAGNGLRLTKDPGAIGTD